jgi:hypothetical protein
MKYIKYFEKKEMSEDERYLFNLSKRLQYNLRKYFKPDQYGYFRIDSDLWGHDKIYVSFTGVIPNTEDYAKKYDNFNKELKRLKIGSNYFTKVEAEKILNSVKTEFVDLIKEKKELVDIQRKLEPELQEIFYPSSIKILVVPFDEQEFTISIDYSNLDISKYEELIKIMGKSLVMFNPKFRQVIHLKKIESIKLLNNMEKLKINIESKKFNI